MNQLLGMDTVATQWPLTEDNVHVANTGDPTNDAGVTSTRAVVDDVCVLYDPSRTCTATDTKA